ncbi:hypothetical protein B4U80_12669 [Leptotrombidium deliense]|uniref:Kazal-like domain-containing protein n=1 Tax=Leptotrombidium deliense TaxID=299467 RepID=A0A443SS34_9ACAR|nr:hypothetical protein B4U80_12669 [Leptotrombidium deliense]
MNEYCVIKSKSMAVCVQRGTRKSNEAKSSKRKEKKSRYRSEFFDFDPNINRKVMKCKQCPAVRPNFYCGTDNETYSSLCRLEFHNCIHKTNVQVACNGFCPCKANKNSVELAKESRMKQRINKHLNELKQKSRFNKLEKFKKTIANSAIDKTQLKSNSFGSAKYSKKCSKNELQVMGSRLLDWFTVVSSDQKRVQKESKLKKRIAGCKPEIGWMFHHFDVDGDLKLSLKKELYDLEHDEREKCLKQYLDGCDEDRDTYLKPYEWCSCFQKKSMYSFVSHRESSVYLETR